MEAYRVGVTFALNNLVSAELAKMTGQFLEANDAAKALSATLKTLDFGASATMAVSASATAMGDAFKYASVEIDGVRAKLVTMNAAAGAGGGARHGGGGLLAALSRPGPLIAIATGYEALKGGMSMEDMIARAMIAMGLPVGPNYMASQVAAGIQRSVFSTSTGYGVSMGDTEDAALQAMRALAPLTPDQRLALLPSIMNFAGAEVLGKHGTTMQEAAEAGIALAHQLRAYSPEQIEPLLGAFAKLSMASPQSLAQMARASSYYLPLLTAGLGMDPSELMALGTVGSQMGLNTKAGTWLARMFQSPFTADLTGKRQKERLHALEALGLVEGGKFATNDPIEFLQIMAEHAGSMSPPQRMSAYVAAFGQQGARAASIYTDPAVMKNLLGLTQGLRGAPTPEALRGQYANSPLVQFHQAESDLSKAFTQLGEALMPEATIALKGFSVVVEGIAKILSAPEWLGAKAAAGVRAGYNWATGGGSTVPTSAASQAVVIQHQTNLDGRAIAQSTTRYQLDGLAKAPASGNNFDLRATPLATGF
jgi:hypothetical protein